MKIDPKNTTIPEIHQYLLGAIAPRPIAFASTISQSGQVNLSPYSFFNCFSANPPILIFSAARRVRGNTTKHTLHNARETKEVVINVVNYPIVEQMSLSSTEYAEGVNEFVKSGLTEVSSELVAPPRVKESPVAFECKVKEIIALGQEGGAGNLIVCEVVMMHIDDKMLNDQRQIDPFKMDHVARMGGNWYSRIVEEAIFEIPKPIRTKGIGVDSLPGSVRNSTVLTGNNLGRLGNLEALPSDHEVAIHQELPEVTEALSAVNPGEALHKLAQQQLATDALQALKTLIVADKR
ncbi:MAG: flavin reductase family protein [Bacteroidota bacterium]